MYGGIASQYLRVLQGINLLTEYVPTTSLLNPTIVAHQELRKISLRHNNSEVKSDKHIVKIVSEIQKILDNDAINVETKESQIFRRNSVDLNCNRHMSVFNTHSIIPEFCFGCYKVQVEPRSARQGGWDGNCKAPNRFEFSEGQRYRF